MTRPLILGLLLALAPSYAPPAPAASSASVGTLRVEVPPGDFVVHGTLPVPLQPFARPACPYRLLDPSGAPLDTQWELVARTRDHLIVELRAHVENRWSGTQTFEVVPGKNAFHVQDFLAEPVALALVPGAVRVEIEDQAGGLHRHSLSGRLAATSFERIGPATLTMRRQANTGFGDFQVWFEVDAKRSEVELILNWHDGALPARPDVYFRSLRLLLPGGWTWTPRLPDPAMSPPTGGGYLVAPDDHVLPQRMERSFRLVLHRVGVTPDLSGRGFGVGDWSRGGYLAQASALPDLSHVRIDLEPKRLDDFDRLAKLLPTANAGAVPVSALWPAAGVQYGGMTGGLDVEQYPGVPLAVSGDPDGLLSLWVEQLRYASRQMGCIYQSDGEPLVLDDYLRADGSAPWDLFNNRFLGSPPKDEPFRFSQTGPGVGTAAYDPLLFEPIDVQHYVRRTKANKVLVWLTNDPLARLYLRMDAELARMTFFEGVGGRLVVPTMLGLGSTMGRADAWAADCLAHAWAIEDDAWRRRNASWFVSFHDALAASQMPNGLFSATRTSKVAKDPPYGDGTNPFYWAHRSNEQVFLVHALRALDRTVGIDTSDLIRSAGRALWTFAWKVGATGPLERYPAGPIGGPRFTRRSDIPAGLTDTIIPDAYQVGTLFGHVHEAGREMYRALLAYTSASSVQEALTRFESWGLDNIQNRANTLAVLQQLLAP